MFVCLPYRLSNFLKMSIVMLVLLGKIGLYAQSDTVKTLIEESQFAINNKNTSLSLSKAQAALEVANREGAATNISTALINLGRIHHALNKIDKAISYYNEAVEQFKKIPALNKVAQTQIDIAILYNEKGDFKQTVLYAQQGIEGMYKTKSTAGLSKGYEILITGYMNLEDLSKAIEVQQKFAFFKDSVANSIRQKELLELQTQYETEKKDKAILILNQEKLVTNLKLQQQNLDLINQKLLTEKNQKNVDLLQQSKRLQEAELARTTSELKTEKQAAEVSEKNNAILRGSLIILFLRSKSVV